MTQEDGKMDLKECVRGLFISWSRGVGGGGPLGRPALAVYMITKLRGHPRISVF